MYIIVYILDPDLIAGMGLHWLLLIITKCKPEVGSMINQFRPLEVIKSARLVGI